MRRRSLRDDAGSILLVTGLTVPVLLLFAAFAIEVGGWYVHKRSLQNRADAAALAAGASYATRFPDCTTDGALENEIVDEANRFAGKPGVTGAVNTAVSDQAKVTVTINGTDPTRGPCDIHPAADDYSQANRYWTDVKVTETAVGGLVSGFVGVGAPDISAQARVELRQISTTSGMRPFALQNAASTSCVSADFNVGGGDIDLTASGGAWTGTQTRQLGNSDTQVDLEIGCQSPDTYDAMAWVTVLPDPPDDRLTSLTLTPQGTCTNGNPYFIPFDGVACTMTVVAGVGFEFANQREVRIRTGINPSGQGTVMTAVPPSGSGLFTATVTVNPASGSATDGLFEIEILAKSRPNPTGGSPNADPIGRMMVQAGTADQQGPIADVVLADHDHRPTESIGAITVRLRGLTEGQKMSIAGGVDCDNGGAPNLATTFRNGCTAQYTRSSGGSCNTTTQPFDCIEGIGDGSLNSLSGGNANSEYNQKWAPGGVCTPNTWPNVEDGDPRLITMFVTDSVPRTQNASQDYPITDFAAFYVTGWEGAVASCLPAGQPGKNETPPPGQQVSQGRVWGRFMRLVQTSSGATPGAAGCTAAGSEACVATLVR